MKTAARTALATFCLLGAGGLPLASCATGVLGGDEEFDAASSQDGAQDGAEDASVSNDAPVTTPRDASPAGDAAPAPTLTDGQTADSANAADVHDAQPDTQSDASDASDSSAIIPALGLVGQWLCSGNTSDTSGSGNDGTGTNVSFVADRNGNPNAACSFDGTTSYIAIPDAPSLDVTSAWSMSAWVQPSGFSFLAGIASKYQTPSANGPTFRLSFAPPFTGVDVDESSEVDAAASGLLAQGVWSHVAVTVSGTTVLCYIDGSLAYTGAAGYVAQANTDPLDIGLDFATRFFAGAIDDVLLYDRALSAAEVEAIYLAH